MGTRHKVRERESERVREREREREDKKEKRKGNLVSWEVHLKYTLLSSYPAPPSFPPSLVPSPHFWYFIHYHHLFLLSLIQFCILLHTPLLCTFNCLFPMSFVTRSLALYMSLLISQVFCVSVRVQTVEFFWSPITCIPPLFSSILNKGTHTAHIKAHTCVGHVHSFHIKDT